MPYCLLCSLLLFTATTLGQTGGFELESDDDDVRVYVRQEGNDDMSVRVVTTVRAGIEEVRAVLDDAPNYPEWVHRCEAAYRVTGGTDDAYLFVSAIDLPFPFRDKEVVARIRQWMDAEGTLHRTITAEPGAIAPTDGKERMEVYLGEWLVTPASTDGLLTLQCTVRTDAGSGLPAWLRKEILTGGPARTMANLRRRLEAAR